MKRQYIALLIILAMLAIQSFLVASTTTTHDIEQQLTNTSNEQHENQEGLIEGGNLMLYVGATGVLLFIAIGAYFLVIKRR